MNYYEYIEQYCEDLLDKTARSKFEMAMSKDKNLAADVERYQKAKKISEGLFEIDIMETIENLKYENEISNSNESHDILTIDKSKDNFGKKINIRRWLIAASISGVLIFSAWWLTNNTAINNDKLFTALYHEPVWSIERSGDQSYLTKAVRYYLDSDIDEAKSLLLDSIDNKELGKLWLAEMYLKDGQIDSTIHYLPSFNSMTKGKNRIIYLNLLISIKQGNIEKAKALCRQLPEDEYGDVYEKLDLD